MSVTEEPSPSPVESLNASCENEEVKLYFPILFYKCTSNYALNFLLLNYVCEGASD